MVTMPAGWTRRRSTSRLTCSATTSAVGSRPRRSSAEHWWTHHGQAVALVVGAPETDLAAARSAIGTAVATVADGLDDVTVRDAATRIRRELLFHSRTPDRMAELVGGFVDRTGDPDALQRFFDALDRVGPRDVERVLERLATRTPARVDVPPQVLPSS
jgi:predicted Zn-dependent peptidase